MKNDVKYNYPLFILFCLSINLTIMHSIYDKQIKLNEQAQQIQNIQRILKCRDLQLQEYRKRIAKLQEKNEQMTQKLLLFTEKNEILEKQLKSQKEDNAVKISKLNQNIQELKKQLRLQPQKIANSVNINESEYDTSISIGDHESSLSEESSSNTQDRLFRATPDNIDNLMLGEDCDYNPTCDVDQSSSCEDELN